MSSRIGFQAWVTALREDCRGQGKLREFDGLGQYVLQLLWETGVQPSVQAIVGQPGMESSPLYSTPDSKDPKAQVPAAGAPTAESLSGGAGGRRAEGEIPLKPSLPKLRSL